jgi:Helix-turn-helix domain of resolvase
MKTHCVQSARAQGVKIGRPSKLNDAVRTSVKLLRNGGMGIKEISKRLEIGVGSVYGALRTEKPWMTLHTSSHLSTDQSNSNLKLDTQTTHATHSE